jgi:hypothetical protein
VYATCAFCNGAFAGDGGPSGLGVGRRFAFDEWKGRLWVVCGRCARWNLAPFDDRLERIEALADAAAQGKLLAKTDQIALLRWQGYDLVRVGRPPRVELASWRYGERLKQQSREKAKIVVPVIVVGVGLTIALNAAVGGGFGAMLYNIGTLGDAVYTGIIGRRRVALAEPPICASCHTPMRVQARHVQHARLVADRADALALVLSCPACHREGAMLTGPEAGQALRQGLTYLNVRKHARRRAADAAREVDAVGGPDQLIQRVARQDVLIHRIPNERRVALEMAVDEHLEVLELERQWREAEELAQIADGDLSPSAELEQLKNQQKS